MMELDNCPCSGANLPRFVQPVILAVLSSGPLHGYLVVQRLAETSLFRKQPPDATGVYRMLRNMEQEGVLESDWELENSGPARKRYTLTEKGGHCLDQWMRTLTSHQAFIANLLLFLQDARSGMNSEPYIRRRCSCPPDRLFHPPLAVAGHLNLLPEPYI